jgi:hypothetical protein
MHATLKHAIAKNLSEAGIVGLFRQQLFSKLPEHVTDNNIERVSQVLNAMLTEGHVDKSARQGSNGSRWFMTAKGRAAYSVLHA